MNYKMGEKKYLSILSVLLIALGLLLIAFKSALYDMGISKATTFKPGSSLFNAWVRSPPDVNFNVYFFNWTNPQDFYNTSVKPAFKEIGPFKFYQQVDKINTTFHDNGTVSYYRRRTFKLRDDSPHKLDENVTILNPVSVGAAFKAKDWNYLMKKFVQMAMTDDIHLTRPAGELMFDGYPDPILQLKSKFSTEEGPQMDKFAFFYGKNGSATFDGLFTMGDGESYPLGEIYLWNNKNSTPNFDEACNTYGGSNGDFFPKNLGQEPMHVFYNDMCRQIIAEFTGTASIRGINGYKFEMDKRFLDNGTEIPGNECYCSDYCLPSGAVLATACKGFSPNYISLPHFYKADPYYLENVEGLKPIPEKHEFHLIIEPMTGLPLELLPRFQINTFVRPISTIAPFEEAPTLLFPLIWFEQVMTLNSSSAFLLKIVFNLKEICWVVGVTLIIGGVILFLFSVHKIHKKNFRPNQSKEYLPKELVPLNDKTASSVPS